MEFTPNVILGKQKSDWIAGVNNPEPIIDRGVKWIDFKPEHELQNKGYETAACTVFGSLNAIETLMMYFASKNLIPPEITAWMSFKKYWKNGFINFSDRFIANFADIQPEKGTFLYKTADAIRLNGCVPEDMLPYTADGYYSGVTQLLTDLGKEFEGKIKITWNWVEKGNEREYLKQAPMIATVKFANFVNPDDILKPEGSHNHCVEVLDITDEYVLINDSYTQELKKYHPDYVDNYLQYNITFQNNMLSPTFLIDNDLCLVRNTDTGAYGCVIARKLRTISAERAGLFMVDREARGVKDKPMISINSSEWDSLDKTEF